MWTDDVTPRGRDGPGSTVPKENTGVVPPSVPGREGHGRVCGRDPLIRRNDGILNDIRDDVSSNTRSRPPPHQTVEFADVSRRWTAPPGATRTIWELSTGEDRTNFTFTNVV